jgi:anti-sigma B factor antagonist
MTSSSPIVEIAVDQARLDAAAAPQFREHISARLTERPDRVLLDMRPVQFVDSTGLGVLVSLLKMMAAGGKIAIVGANESVRRLLAMTKLDTLFLLFDDEGEARAALA